MIELNGIYKLKKIKGFEDSDDSDFQVIAKDYVNQETGYCKNLTTGEHFCFMSQFLVDPEKPEDSVFELIKIEK